MQILTFLLARFSEPSSYAGLGAILAFAGLHFSDSDLGQIAQFLAAGCGLAALLLKERRVIQMVALAVMLGATLTACGGTNSPNKTSAPTGAVAILTATQQAMCAAQSAANLAGTVAASAGDATAAGDASKASIAAGIGCTWTNPAAPITPTPATPTPAT